MQYLPNLQYTMLCGKAPFHANIREENSSVVVQRIKIGAFGFEGDAWLNVSSKAKSLIKGKKY